jgi:predicted RNA-binding Zn-ribbon protein involved in translation (DUF1610 family)
MEESKKKAIMIAVIVVCLTLAGAITYITKTGSSGTVESLKRGQLTWLKCRNPDCEHEYQMDLKDYFIYVRDHQEPMSLVAPAIVCPNCGEKGVYKAGKCEKCGLVFETGSVPLDFEDRCPECGYSKTEASRKESRARRDE